MKTKNMLAAMAMIAAVFVSACKKESTKMGTPLATATPELRSENGILQFKDRAAFNKTIQALQQKDQAGAAAWGKAYYFKSYFTRFNEINEQELLHEEVCMKTKNMAVPHSRSYYAAVTNHFIKEIKEADGATSFEYNLLDASAVYVINEEALVIIGNTLYQYTTTGLKEAPYAGPESINALKAATATSGDIKVTNFTRIEPAEANKIAGQRGTPTSFYWSKSLDGGWVQYSSKPKKRAIMHTDGYSYASGSSSVSDCTFKITIQVEKKNGWGNWVYGNNTTCYLPHSWNYKFALQKNATPFTDDIFYSLGLSTTPVAHSYNQSYWPTINYLVLNLEPNGVLNTLGTGYDVFSSAVNVYTYNFTAYLDQVVLSLSK